MAQLADGLARAENPGLEEGDVDDAVAAKRGDIIQLCLDQTSWAAMLARKGLLKSKAP